MATKLYGKYYCGEGKYQQIYNRMADDLVPRCGKSPTVGGEMLRAALKLSNEFFRNKFFYDTSGAVKYLRTHLAGRCAPENDDDDDDDDGVCRERLVAALDYVEPMTVAGENAYTVHHHESRKRINTRVGTSIDVIIDAVVHFNANDERAKQTNDVDWTDLQERRRDSSSSSSSSPSSSSSSRDSDDEDPDVPDDLDTNLLFLRGVNLKDAMLTVFRQEMKGATAAAAKKNPVKRKPRVVFTAKRKPAKRKRAASTARNRPVKKKRVASTANKRKKSNPATKNTRRRAR